MAKIALPNGDTLLIDDADVPALAGRNWFSIDKNGKRYAEGRLKGRKAGEKINRISLHRLLTGWPRVDHRNGNGLDNQRSNLRPATQRQNTYNRGPDIGKTFKGVYFDARREKYYSQIVADGVCYCGPYGSSEEVCARWYDTMAKKLHGEFARLNFPDETPA